MESGGSLHTWIRGPMHCRFNARVLVRPVNDQTRKVRLHF